MRVKKKHIIRFLSQKLSSPSHRNARTELSLPITERRLKGAMSPYDPLLTNAVRESLVEYMIDRRWNVDEAELHKVWASVVKEYPILTNREEILRESVVEFARKILTTNYTLDVTERALHLAERFSGVDKKRLVVLALEDCLRSNHFKRAKALLGFIDSEEERKKFANKISMNRFAYLLDAALYYDIRAELSQVDAPELYLSVVANLFRRGTQPNKLLILINRSIELGLPLPKKAVNEFIVDFAVSHLLPSLSRLPLGSLSEEGLAVPVYEMVSQAPKLLNRRAKFLLAVLSAKELTKDVIDGKLGRASLERMFYWKVTPEGAPIDRRAVLHGIAFAVAEESFSFMEQYFSFIDELSSQLFRAKEEIEKLAELSRRKANLILMANEDYAYTSHSPEELRTLLLELSSMHPWKAYMAWRYYRESMANPEELDAIFELITDRALIYVLRSGDVEKAFELMRYVEGKTLNV